LLCLEHTRGATLLVFSTRLSVHTPCEPPLLHQRSAGGKTTFLGDLLYGNHPSALLATIRNGSFLRSAASEGVLRVHTHSELSPTSDRCRELHAYFFRSTRVSLHHLYDAVSITGYLFICQPHDYQIYAATNVCGSDAFLKVKPYALLFRDDKDICLNIMVHHIQ